MNISRYFFMGVLMVALNQVNAQKKVDVLTVPAGNEFAKINPGGRTVLPSGRFATPADRKSTRLNSSHT